MAEFDLAAFAASCGVAEPERFAERCEALRLLLVAANEHVNLTRIVEPEAFAIKHIADSLSILRFFPELGRERMLLADIGCGAGFPSLALALACPNLSICAIDSTGKKTAFVASAAAALGLDRLRVVNGRSRELNRRPEFRRRFDAVTARAVAEGPVIWQDARDFANRHGRFILYKTPEQAAAELPALRELDREKRLNWEVTELFELPAAAGSRQFLFSTPPRG